MASTDATPIPVINTAFRVTFPILDNTGALVSGAASLAAKVSKDAGTFASSSNTPTEIATSSGMYYLDLTSTEMNAQTVAVMVTTTTTNANATPMVIYTYVSGTTALLDSNVKKFGGTTVTGRDIGASVLLSSGTGTGQINLSSGKVAEVVLVDTLTTYTGNTLQTGDAYARIGAAGAGLTALGDTRIANLNATVSSRMATYTQPTGFLSATFPSGTVASTTNITAGTINTVTNLTNAPTSGDFNPTMKTSLNNSTPAAITGNVNGVTGVTFPAVVASADAVWDVDLSSHLTGGSTGAALNDAGGGGSAPTVGEIDTQLSSTHGSGQWGSSSGSGAFQVTLTVTDGTNPVANANVRLSNGITAPVLVTNGSGVTAPYFSLDAGTWAVSITKSGYSFSGTSIVVTTSANFNETLTPVVIPSPPSGSPYCNVYGYFEGLSTSTSAGAPITFTLSHTPSKSGSIIINAPIVATIVNGQILGPRDAPFVALVRNDSITPLSTTYSVTCQAIGFSNVEMTLAADTFDLSSLIS